MAIFIHSTDRKPFKRFLTREVWCDTVGRDYGINEATISYPLDLNKVFVTRRDAGDYPEFGVTDEQGSKNRELYKALGGEVSRKPFNWARRQGYTAIFDEEGWCLLYPRRVKIMHWYEEASHPLNFTVGGSAMKNPSLVKNGVHEMNPRPPKEWFDDMMARARKQYPRFGKTRLMKVVGGIWWGYSPVVRKRLLTQYEGAAANPRRMRRNITRKQGIGLGTVALIGVIAYFVWRNFKGKP